MEQPLYVVDHISCVALDRMPLVGPCWVPSIRFENEIKSETTTMYGAVQIREWKSVNAVDVWGSPFRFISRVAEWHAFISTFGIIIIFMFLVSFAFAEFGRKNESSVHLIAS